MMRVKSQKKMVFVLLAVFIVIVFPIVNTFVNSRKEHHRRYDFIISKVKETPTKSLELYNMRGEKISLWNYTIMSNAGVEAGDSVYKGECSYFLYVFKKDNQGKYKEFKRFNPSGLFPISMFCK